MTVAFDCAECGAECYNTGAEPEDYAFDGDSLDFSCEICGCEFTITYRAPDVVVTKHGDNKGGA